MSPLPAPGQVSGHAFRPADPPAAACATQFCVDGTFPLVPPFARRFLPRAMRPLCAALLLASVAASSFGQIYTVTSIGPLSGGTLSSATDINSSGSISGYSNFTPSSSTRTLTASGTTLTNLGAPAGATASWGWGINDSGAIAGSAIVSFQGTAFVYQNGTFTTLPTLGGSSASARDINNAGQVTGQAAVSNTVNHAFRYNLASGLMEDLGTLGGANSTGYAINANGWIVGTSDVAMTGFATRAFLARPGRSMFGLTLGGNFSAGYGINDAGKIVGQSSLLNNDNQRNAFLFTGEAVLNLGTLGGTQATAYAINNADVIVGSSLTAGDNNTFHAFIYQNGVMTDLNSLIAPGSGWMLNEALAINDAGQIVGYGTIGGQQHGFLLSLSAIPEPSTYALIAGLATLGLVALRRRRTA